MHSKQKSLSKKFLTSRSGELHSISTCRLRREVFVGQHLSVWVHNESSCIASALLAALKAFLGLCPLHASPHFIHRLLGTQELVEHLLLQRSSDQGSKTSALNELRTYSITERLVRAVPVTRYRQRDRDVEHDQTPQRSAMQQLAKSQRTWHGRGPASCSGFVLLACVCKLVGPQSSSWKLRLK